MASAILVCAAAAIVFAWGVAHLVPTREVVAGFGDISIANHVAVLVYRLAAGLVAAIAVLTELTGAHTPVRWFKACPLVLGTAVVLLAAASVL